VVGGGDWVAVPRQQLGHFGAGPDPCEKLVVFRRHHVRALYIFERCSTPLEIFDPGATPYHLTGSSGRPSKNRLSVVSVLKEANSASPSVSKNPFRFANSSSSLSVFSPIEPSWESLYIMRTRTSAAMLR